MPCERAPDRHSCLRDPPATSTSCSPMSGCAANGSIGSELDLVLRYQPARRVEVRFGVSRFFAGRFVARNLPDGESQTFLITALTIQL